MIQSVSTERSATRSGCFKRLGRMIALFLAGLCGIFVLGFCGLLWWVFKDCDAESTPAPFPNTVLTEDVIERNATIYSQTRTISYTLQTVAIEQLADHYAREMQKACEPGSIQPLAPSTGSTSDGLPYHAQCSIQGWEGGGYTFFPEGGYSFKTTQSVEIDATLYSDGTISVRHTEDFAQGC
jgi:hypothetical protein